MRPNKTPMDGKPSVATGYVPMSRKHRAGVATYSAGVATYIGGVATYSAGVATYNGGVATYSAGVALCLWLSDCRR